MSDSESSQESEDGLSALIGKVGNTPKKVFSNFPGVKSSHQSDDLDLIKIPDNSEKFIQIALQDRAIKQDIDTKKRLNEAHKMRMDSLRSNLLTELSDNGGENNNDSLDKLVEDMLNQDENLLSFKRAFYLFSYVPSNPYEMYYCFKDRDLSDLEVIEKYNLLHAPFQYTSLDYLRDVDLFLDKCANVKLKVNSIESVFPFQGLMWTPDRIQNDTFSFKFKLQHFNNNPLVGLIRLSIYIRLRILCSSIDNSVYTMFFAALCDANLCKSYYKELLEFSKLIYSLYKSYSPDISELIQLITCHVSVYNYDADSLYCWIYATQLKYNILNILHTSTILDDSYSLVKQRVNDAIIEFIGYDNIKQFIERVISVVKIDCNELFTSPHLLLEVFENHHKLRLLHVLVDYDTNATSAKTISSLFTTAKQHFHELMGQISFSAFDDKFHQRTQVIKLLDQDYTYLDYFQVKFFQIYSYTSGNRFYEDHIPI